MTKLKKIKSAFRNGEKMTHLDALRSFGTNRLAAYVHTLRKEGMNIDSTSAPGTNYYTYWLNTGG